MSINGGKTLFVAAFMCVLSPLAATGDSLLSRRAAEDDKQVSSNKEVTGSRTDDKVAAGSKNNDKVNENKTTEDEVAKRGGAAVTETTNDAMADSQSATHWRREHCVNWPHIPNWYHGMPKWQACEEGNNLDNGFHYIYNRHRDSSYPLCGFGQNCWCCGHSHRGGLRSSSVALPANASMTAGNVNGSKNFLAPKTSPSSLPSPADTKNNAQIQDKLSNNANDSTTELEGKFEDQIRQMQAKVEESVSDEFQNMTGQAQGPRVMSSWWHHRQGETCCMCSAHFGRKTLLYSAEDYDHSYGNHNAMWHCMDECEWKCNGNSHHGHKFGCYDEQHLRWMNSHFGHDSHYHIVHNFGDIC